MPPTAGIKPIQTRAYGRLFRSRLEARWAVFFTSLGLTWEYEPEGFDLGGELYLPDFRVWTPQGKPIWYEVKPAHVAEDGKLRRFAAALENQAIRDQDEDGKYQAARTGLLCGDPRHFLVNHDFCPRCGWCLNSVEVEDAKDSIAFSCYACDWETASHGGNPDEADGVAGIYYEPYYGRILITYQSGLRWLKIVNASATKALSARFEHGEAPL